VSFAEGPVAGPSRFAPCPPAGGPADVGSPASPAWPRSSGATSADELSTA